MASAQDMNILPSQGHPQLELFSGTHDPAGHPVDSGLTAPLA